MILLTQVEMAAGLDFGSIDIFIRPECENKGIDHKRM
jgi:hypothetical protein